MATTIEMPFTAAQRAFLLDCNERRRVVTKGRRVGFTRGCAMYVISKMADGTYKTVLWGDTTHLNIKNYVDRYFMPILKKLPGRGVLWDWSVTNKMLRIGESVCDFRSADNPENWEGFGYDLVILNEAGIILKDESLYKNSVRPMLMDNPQSVCVIGGTPKGKGLFYELWRKGADRTKGWRSFKFSTYDNETLDPSAVDELVEEMVGSETTIKQEIYGEFVDVAVDALFNYEDIIKAMDRTPAQTGGFSVEVWGIDIAAHGDDTSQIAMRRDNYFFNVQEVGYADLMATADKIMSVWYDAARKPDAIFIDVIGMGLGVASRLRQCGIPNIIDVHGGSQASNPKMWRNKRSEMLWKLAEASRTEQFAMPKILQRLKEFTALQYEIGEAGVIRVLPKVMVKHEIGFSPDLSDAMALTYAMPVVRMKTAIELMEDEQRPTGVW